MIPRNFRHLLFAGLIFLLPSCHRVNHSPEGVVATLSGKPISSTDLRETARFIGLDNLTNRPLDTWSPVLASLVLRETVYDRLLEERAEKIGLEVTPEEVDEERKRLAKRSAPSSSRSPYVPPDSLVRRKLLLEKAAKEVAPAHEVTLKELKAVYKRNLVHFTVPERAVVKDIVVRSEEEGKAILAALAAGNSFSALAKAKSLSPEGKKGGLLPPFAMGEMPAPFNRVFSMKPGEVSPLISSPYGYHILKLVSLMPAHVRSFSDVKASIRKRMIRKIRKKELGDWISKELQQHPLIILPRYRPLLSVNGS